MADVTISEFCFSTPRIIMQRCRQRNTTPTPSALAASWIAYATCSVSRSWICRRRAKQSTMRAIFETPSTLPRAM